MQRTEICYVNFVSLPRSSFTDSQQIMAVIISYATTAARCSWPGTVGVGAIAQGRLKRAYAELSPCPSFVQL